MTAKKIVLITLCLLGLITNGLAQQAKMDTIYYLLDTIRTPRNDQMIIVHNNGSEKNNHNAQRIFTINCSCLRPDGAMPAFETFLRYEKTINANFFNTLKLASLASIIKLAIDNDTENNFNEKYVLYIISPTKKGDYLMDRTVYTGPMRRWNTTN